MKTIMSKYLFIYHGLKVLLSAIPEAQPTGVIPPEIFIGSLSDLYLSSSKLINFLYTIIFIFRS